MLAGSGRIKSFADIADEALGFPERWACRTAFCVIVGEIEAFSHEFFFQLPPPFTSVSYVGNLSGVSTLVASLGHTRRRRVVLGHTINTQTLRKPDEHKKRL